MGYDNTSFQGSFLWRFALGKTITCQERSQNQMFLDCQFHVKYYLSRWEGAGILYISFLLLDQIKVIAFHWRYVHGPSCELLLNPTRTIQTSRVFLLFRCKSWQRYYFLLIIRLSKLLRFDTKILLYYTVLKMMSTWPGLLWTDGYAETQPDIISWVILANAKDK